MRQPASPPTSRGRATAWWRRRRSRSPAPSRTRTCPRRARARSRRSPRACRCGPWGAAARLQHRGDLVLHRQPHRLEVDRDALIEVGLVEIAQRPEALLAAGVVEGPIGPEGDRGVLRAAAAAGLASKLRLLRRRRDVLHLQALRARDASAAQGPSLMRVSSSSRSSTTSFGGHGTKPRVTLALLTLSCSRNSFWRDWRSTGAAPPCTTTA